MLTHADADVDLRAYRTFFGPPAGHPRPATSRIERAFVVVIATAVIVGAIMLTDLATEVPAAVAGLGGGMALIAGLAGPDPRRVNPPSAPLVAIYPRRVARGDLPQVVTRINLDELDRLGADGYGSLVGSARPGGTLGIFVDDYLVWARTPPRGGINLDPRFGID